MTPRIAAAALTVARHGGRVIVVEANWEMCRRSFGEFLPWVNIDEQVYNAADRQQIINHLSGGGIRYASYAAHTATRGLEADVMIIGRTLHQLPDEAFWAFQPSIAASPISRFLRC